MKRFLALLLISGTALAQSSRYDTNAWTAATNVPIGAEAPIYTIPYASVNICTDSSCATPVNIYLDQAKTQLITQPFLADAFGKYGFWAAPGTYWYSACDAADNCDTGWITVGGSGAGSGSVTNFSAGNLAPLFTTTVTNPTTTPNLAFNLSNAQSFGFYGNVAGTTGAPSFTTLLAGANVTFTPAIGSPNTLTVSASGGGGTGCTGPLAAGDVLFSTISGGCNGSPKFFTDSNADVDISGGGSLEIDDNANPTHNRTIFLGSHITEYSAGDTNLGGIDLEVTDDDYTGGSNGQSPYYLNLAVDRTGTNGIGAELHVTCGATGNCDGISGAQVFVGGTGGKYAATEYGYLAEINDADSSNPTTMVGFLTTPPVGGPIAANYCDFAGERGAGVWAVQIGCGPNSTSTFSGTVRAPIIAPTTLYSAAGTALPACGVSLKGARAVVSDATSPTYMGAYNSGGAITAEVICSYNGTTYSWLTH